MKRKFVGCLFFVFVLALTVSLGARPQNGNSDNSNGDGKNGSVQCNSGENPNTAIGPAVGVILAPGLPLTRSDLSYVDPGTERMYFDDADNAAVQIFDAEDDVWVGAVKGFTGGAVVATRGPSGMAVTPDHVLFTADGGSKVQVADVDPSDAFGNYLKFVYPTNACSSNCGISTVNTSAGECGTVSVAACQKTDEVGYDPADHILMVGQAPAGFAPYVSFISTKGCTRAAINTNSCTLSVLQQTVLAGAGGVEQPLWNPGLGLFQVTVPGTCSAAPCAAGTQLPEIAFFDPQHLSSGVVKTITFDCTNNVALAGVGGSGNGADGESLGAGQHVELGVCGLNVMVNAKSGKILAVIPKASIGTGDEYWYNPGDDSFYFTAGGLLGIVNGETGALSQSLPAVGGRNPSAFAENNHVFVPIRPPTTGPDTTTVCAEFGFGGSTTVAPPGCIAVYEHLEPARTLESNNDH